MNDQTNNMDIDSIILESYNSSSNLDDLNFQNKNVLMKFSNNSSDNDILLEINKDVLNFQNSDKILNSLGFNKHNNNNDIRKINTNDSNSIQNSGISKPRKTPLRRNNKEVHTDINNNGSRQAIQLNNIKNENDLLTKFSLKKDTTNKIISFDWNILFCDLILPRRSCSRSHNQNIKLSFNQYFSNESRCDICNKFGITYEELKQSKDSNNNNNNDLVEEVCKNNYFLYSCDSCKVKVHKYCCLNKDSFEKMVERKHENGYNNDTNNDTNNDNYNVNYNDKWLCEYCQQLLLINNNDVKEQNSNIDQNKKCQLCLRSQTNLKNPHLYLQIAEHNWIHQICYLWLSYFKTSNVNGVKEDDNKDETNNNNNKDYNDDKQLIDKINEIEKSEIENIVKSNETICFICNDENNKLIKCSDKDCNKYYHPICMKEYRLYNELFSLDNTSLIMTSFCEDHSKIYIAYELNNL